MDEPGRTWKIAAAALMPRIEHHIKERIVGGTLPETGMYVDQWP
jgi:hypothetical protein